MTEVWASTRVHEDIEFCVRSRLSHGCYLEFEVFDVTGHQQSAPGKFDVPIYRRAGAPADITESVDQAERYAHGDIKFDGCCNVSFDNDGTMLHACDRTGMTRLGTLFERLYDLAAELMPDSAEEYLR